MLEKFFNSSRSGPGRVRSLREGQHGSLLDRFSGELLRSRYANITARRHIRAAEHFAHWATSQSIAISQWDKSVLERFGLHLRRRRCPFGHSGPAHQLTGASLFLEHLRLAGIIRNAPVEPGDRPALLISFRRWMREQRGTQDAALDNYDRAICALLGHIEHSPERLNARNLRQFFLMLQRW
jgi:integrase/recombinase XerD